MIRTIQRTGSYDTFERLFQPIPRPDGTVLWDPHELPQTHVDRRHWWTVLDCDGRLYLSAGFRYINRFAYVQCGVPWSDTDQPRDYFYDQDGEP